jgi:methionyl-tRNA formyltransferase
LEWALLEGGQTGITVFCIDEGIDTGSPILLTRLISVSEKSSLTEAKQFLFDQDAESYALAISKIQNGDIEPVEQVLDQGQRYYRMSQLTTSVVSFYFAENYG